MPLSILLNREPISTIRTKINAAITQLNTNTDDIATNTADIATNTANIATNTANIATNTTDISNNTAAIVLRQLANSETTLRYRVLPISTSSTVNIIAGYANQILYITPGAPINVSIPAPSTMAGFSSLGVPVMICNDSASGNSLTIVPSGCTFDGSTTIVPGEVAFVVSLEAAKWLRMVFT